jgi:hypothetical protein
MAIFEVFYQPGKLFSTLEQRRAAWLLPMILGALLALATVAAAIHYIGMESIVRQRVEGTRLSPEQMQIAMSRALSPAQTYITYAGTVVVGVLAYLVIAGMLTVFALMSSKEPRFSTNLSMVTLAFLPYRFIVCLMALLVLIAAPDKTSLDATNLLATNVGAFVNKETMSRGLYALLSQIDVLTFTEIGLLSYGFSKVNRTSIGFGLMAVLTLWAIYVAFVVGASVLF